MMANSISCSIPGAVKIALHSGIDLFGVQFFVKAMAQRVGNEN